MKPMTQYRPTAKWPVEVYVTCLREVAAPVDILDTPQQAADYWRANVETSPEYRPDQEQFVVILLNARRRPIGHSIVTRGILDSTQMHPRETFRAAIVSNAHAIIMAHNHPSGETTPSEADIRGTRDMIRAGTMLKIEVLDHIIMADSKHTSLRELGYFTI
jgi:DNA repair protein RadC